MTTPPRPEGWTKTLRELLAEKRGMTGHEIAWAREYEREQLRSWARFPKPGEVFELIEDAEVSYVTHWSTAYTGGGKGRLRKGTRVRIADEISDDEPLGMHADALDKTAVELELVPVEDRNQLAYAGYSLSLSTAELNQAFRLITD